MSVVLSSVILTSVLCIIVFASSNVANDAINGEMETAQFDQAKNVMLAVDKLIKRIMYKPESSGYVKTSFWTVTPSFVETGEILTLKVKVNETTMYENLIPVNIVKFKGGSRVGVAADKALIGTMNFVLTDISNSIGRVCVNQSNGAWISLDYTRIRCTNSGTTQFYTGGSYEPYNVIEITVIELIFGEMRAEEKASIVARNIGMTQNQVVVQGDFILEVQKTGVSPTTYTKADLVGQEADCDTIFNVVVIKIEVSIIGDS